MLFRKRRAARRVRFDRLKPVLANYAAPLHWQRKSKRYYSLLLFVALFYGLVFGLTSTYFLLQLSVPLIVLAGLVVWMLPDTDGAPLYLIQKLLFIFLAVLLIWPDYLAISLPGLPWITAVRLVGVPLAFVMLVCVSTSPQLRDEMSETLGGSPAISRLMIAFAAIAVFSVFVSTSISFSISKLIVAGINWFLVFYVSVFVFRTPGNLVRLVRILWVITLVVTMIGIQEWRHSSVPWAGHIPSFLTVEDEAVQRILTGSSRAATGIYRVQSKATTPLGLAEFYALVAPFFIHFIFFARRWWIKAIATLALPIIFVMVRLTDSRLGMVGLFLAVVLYLLIWALLRWRDNKQSLFAPLIIAAYPAVFVACIAATFLVGRLRVLIWGTGAQQASNDSRKLQVVMGIPKLFQRPWGYGIGRGGETLGFANGNGIMTIDNYYLAVALEFGIIGFIVYYSMFVICASACLRRIVRARTSEELLIAPIAVSLLNFIVIKSIFSQLENHALVFALLGAAVALIYRIDRRSSAVGPQTDDSFYFKA